MHAGDALEHAVHGPCGRQRARVQGILRGEQPQLVCKHSLPGLRVRQVVGIHRHQELFVDPLFEVKDRVEAVEPPAVDLLVVSAVQLDEDAVGYHRQSDGRCRKYLLEAQVEAHDAPWDDVVQLPGEWVHARDLDLLPRVLVPGRLHLLLLVVCHEHCLCLRDWPRRRVPPLWRRTAAGRVPLERVPWRTPGGPRCAERGSHPIRCPRQISGEHGHACRGKSLAARGR
mmetsp:Transcript_45346/g.102088  ORF Transcript_45346/g.102088 Transcript_45346/m.102088 type:complete len:228 (+) Transcript_45346:638-1321(+)